MPFIATPSGSFSHSRSHIISYIFMPSRLTEIISQTTAGPLNYNILRLYTLISTLNLATLYSTRQPLIIYITHCCFNYYN